MKYAITAIICATLASAAAPAFAQAGETADNQAVETAQRAAADRIAAIILPEDEIAAAMQQYATAPLIESIIYYPELGAFFASDENFEATFNAAAGVWNASLRESVRELNGRVVADLESRYEAERLEELARFAEAQSDRLRPVFAAFAASSVTFTNVEGLMANEEIRAVLNELRNGEGAPLLTEHRRTIRALLAAVENRKDASYPAMMAAIAQVATENDVELPAREELVAALAGRPDLVEIFAELTPDSEEQAVLIRTGLETSLDYMAQQSPNYARTFERNEGLRDYLGEQMLPTFERVMEAQRNIVLTGFVRHTAASVPAERTAPVLAFLRSDVGAKFIGDVETADARELFTAMLDAQMSAADLEEAADEGATAFETWVGEDQLAQYSEDEIRRFDAFFATQAGTDLETLLVTLADLVSLQHSMTGLVSLPRNSVLMQQHMETYIREQRAQAESD